MANGNDFLRIRDLHLEFDTLTGSVPALVGVDLTLRHGETLGLVGESGCGKSVTSRAVLGLLPKSARITRGAIMLDQSDGTRVDLTKMNRTGDAIRRIRGREISMIFQEPMTSLIPVYTVGTQIIEALLVHNDMTRAKARRRAIEYLDLVGMPDPARQADAYPHELSGGMRQRAMIAMALSCEPELLIADEPTTALDVTIQAQILTLLGRLQRELGMSILLITHNLGVVAAMCRRVAVMYLGRIVEEGSSREVFKEPQHPYTQALLRSVPRMDDQSRKTRLFSIRGRVPHPSIRIAGCPFHPRCDRFMPGTCDAQEPPVIQTSETHSVRCPLYSERSVAANTWDPSEEGSDD